MNELNIEVIRRSLEISGFKTDNWETGVYDEVISRLEVHLTEI